MTKLINLTGQKFGKWTVLDISSNRNFAHRYWICRCDCGFEKEISGANLRSGESTQCLHCRGTTHGMHTTRIYSIWEGMKQRCLNPRAPGYKEYYGGQGVKICKRWLTFENFYADVGNPPKGKSLDRYPDPNGNYEPGNWRWATPKQQIQNRRK